MYEIILKTWYQETPDKRYEEPYPYSFESMESSVEYLNEHIDDILGDYPVDGEIIIRYNKDI